MTRSHCSSQKVVAQLEGILLEHFDLYMSSKVFALWESNEAVIANVLI